MAAGNVQRRPAGTKTNQRKSQSGGPVVGRGRAVEERHPDSPAAPERTWILIRALEARGRFHEARDEARRMLAAYPASPWSADVERHVLVYPLDQPSREETQERLRAEDGRR